MAQTAVEMLDDINQRWESLKNALVRSERDKRELVEVLDYFVKSFEQGPFEPPLHQCGTPDALCDGDCVGWSIQCAQVDIAKTLLAKHKDPAP